MSRQDDEDFFGEVKQKLQACLREEEGRSNSNQKDFKPLFHFERQVSNFCGINALSTDEKIKFTFDRATYQNNLGTIWCHFIFISPNERLIDLVIIIRELMIIADVNLPIFLSGGTLAYRDVCRHNSNLM